MVHRVYGKKLSRGTNERKALLKSLANSVILYEKVTTTEAKAKTVKPFLEKLVTIAKEDSLNSRRRLIAKLGLENSVKKLLEVVGPTFKERPGGYLRITRLGPRPGDAAKMVVVEFVEELRPPEPVIKKGRKEVTDKKPVTAEAQKEKETRKGSKTKKVGTIKAQTLSDSKKLGGSAVAKERSKKVKHEKGSSKKTGK